MLVEKNFLFSQFYNTGNAVTIFEETIYIDVCLMEIEQCYEIYFRSVNHDAALQYAHIRNNSLLSKK